RSGDLCSTPARASALVSFSLFLISPPPPKSTLFPYTTLFRSQHDQNEHGKGQEEVDERAVIDQPVHGSGPGNLHGEPSPVRGRVDRKSTRLNSSHEWISYAVFCLKKKKK